MSVVSNIKAMDILLAVILFLTKRYFVRRIVARAKRWGSVSINLISEICGTDLASLAPRSSKKDVSFWKNVTNAPKCYVYFKKLIKSVFFRLLSEISDTVLLCKWS